MTTQGQAPDLIRDRTWFGQPRGLTILFLTEMWSTFSFFGMRAMLVYYMTKQLLFSQPHSSYVYGLYSSFVYFTPLIGGAISDRWLGRRRAVIAGSSIMALGHFMMAFEPLLYPALATIAIGNGLFLPSLPSQINQLYREGDPRRASAYNIYYVGINLGAFLAPFVCGTVGELYGWHYGFMLAGIGMAIGLATYLLGTPYLPPNKLAEARTPNEAAQGRMTANTYVLLAIVTSIVVIFRTAYEQAGNTLALWADSGINRTLAAGWDIPMTWFQSLNPLLIFLLTPLIIAYWTRQARRGREHSAVAKMATGAFIVCVSFLMLAAISQLATNAGIRASWLWLVFFFLVYTIGELFILPVGLGLFGRIAPARFAATTIAAWFSASFVGNFLAGVVGSYWSVLSNSQFFLLTAGLSGTAGVLLLALVPWARRLEVKAPAALIAGEASFETAIAVEKS